MRILAPAVLVLIGIVTSIKCQSFSENVNPKPELMKLIKFLQPLLTIKSDYNDKVHKSDSSKVHRERVVKLTVPLLGIQRPIGSLTLGIKSELRNCNNISLLQKDYETLIDCHQSNLSLDDSSKKNTNDDSGSEYFRTNKLYLKFKSILLSIEQVFVYYPLRPDVIQSHIDGLPASHELEKLNFVKSNLNLGYYYESVNSLNIRCSGNIFLATNESTLHSYTEFDTDTLIRVIEQVVNNGFLLSLQSVCNKVGIELFTVESEFLLLVKKEISKITLRHTSVAKPFEQALIYKASIDQNISESSLLTNLKIKAESVLVPMLNFNLVQSFNQSTIDSSGSELMALVFPSTLIARVTSAWSYDYFVKTFSLHSDYETKVADFTYSDKAGTIAIDISANKNRLRKLAKSKKDVTVDDDIKVENLSSRPELSFKSDLRTHYDL